ncbi:MAG TPA: hypothetical protein VK132_09585 [Gemmatimonadales bacterium]|nr:hypothetical protein [Gemmatimonadales bacterium]
MDRPAGPAGGADDSHRRHCHRLTDRTCLARRLEGPEQAAPGLRELAKKVELLEAEVDDLTRAVRGLEEESQFLQRLLESSPQRSTLPPPSQP